MYGLRWGAWNGFDGLVEAINDTCRAQVEFVRGDHDKGECLTPTGEKFIVFGGMALCRPGDEKTAEAVAVANISSPLFSHLKSKTGPLYWRFKPELEIQPCEVPAYSDDGPDIDPVTLQKCTMDRNWVRASVYMRLLRSNKPIKEAVYAA